MKKLCVFDVDGVLLNSWPQHHKFLCDMAERYQPQLVIPVLAESYGLVTNGMGDVLRRAGFSEHLINNIIHSEYSRFSEVYSPPLFVGVKEMIQDLAIRKDLAIVSSNELKNVKLGLGTLVSCFRFIFTHGDFPKKRYALSSLIDCYNLKPEELVFVGDTMGDYNEAVLAGVPFVGAGYGWQIRPGDKINGEIVESVGALHQLLLSS